MDRDPAALLRDRPAPATALGVLIGLAGVAIIFLPGGSGGTDLGFAALAVLAALSWAIGSLLVTLRPVPADPLTLTTVEMAAGGWCCWPAPPRTASSPGSRPATHPRGLVRAGLPGGVRLADRLHRVRLAARQRAGLDRVHLRVREPGGGGAARALFAGERLTGSALAGGLVILVAVKAISEPNTTR